MKTTHTIRALLLTMPLVVQAGTPDATTEIDPAKPEILKAKVVRVIEGDTIEIQTKETTETLRLEGIDAPSMDLDSGMHAKEALEHLILNKTIKAEIYGRASIGQANTRTTYSFGKVSLANVDVALEQVSEGHALVLQQNPNVSQALLNAENTARNQNLGLWAELNSNQSLQNWLDATQQAAEQTPSTESIEAEAQGFASENARAWRQLGWGSLPNCSKLVDGGQNCFNVFGKKVCIPNAPRLVTAPQKWFVDINEPTQQELINKVGNTVASNILQNMGRCTAVAIGAAGVTSFWTGATAAKIAFDGSWLGCMQISVGSSIGADVLKSVLSSYQIRARSSCQW